MRTYVIKRLLLIIPTILLVTVIVFLTMRLVPGGVVDIMLAQLIGTGGSSPGVAAAAAQSDTGEGELIDREAVERLLGLDLPIHVQYVRWVGDIILRGDLGDSIWEPATVVESIVGRLPVSIELGILAMAIGLIIAIPVGVYSAMRQDTTGDYVGRTIAIAGLAIPNFWIATMVMIYPSLWWNWSPPMQYINFADDPMGNLGMMLIPAVIMGTSMSAGTMRYTRTMMLEVLRQDYIRTAWSKGLRERVVVTRHALRNALIPVITVVSMQLPVLIGGTVIMEQIFNLPGVGRLMVSAIGRRDYPIVSGINLMLAGFVLLNNVVIDLAYAYLDPRIQYR